MPVARPLRVAIALLLVSVIVSEIVSAQRPRRTSTSRSSRPAREGFWLSGGLGPGSFGCDRCDRQSGLSGGLSAGGTVSPRLLIGAGTAVWRKSERGTTLTTATLDARARFYPSGNAGRFFVTGGLGFGTLRSEVPGFDTRARNGGSVLFGAGADLRVSRSASITPFGNVFVVRSNGRSVNVTQIGAAITLH